MILNDREIRVLLRSKEFVLDPFEDSLVQPSSVDLRLDVFARSIPSSDEEFDVRNKNISDFYAETRLPDEGFVLAPSATLIGQTMEFMTIPVTCQGMIAQRSSLVRLGIHVSSSLINPGYSGNLPLFISNRSARPIRIHSGLPFCQLVLMTLSGRPDVIYPEKKDAKYQGEREVLGSLIAEDAHRWVRPPSPRLVDPTQAKNFQKEVLIAEESDD